MRHPTLPTRLAWGELRMQPWSFLAVAVLIAVATAFTTVALTFLQLAAGEVGDTWRLSSQGTFEDELTSVAMILVFVAVPTIVVVSNLGAAAIANIRRSLMTWRLAGVTPFICAVTVLVQLIVTAIVGALAGVIIAIPVLSPGVGLIMRMAGVDPDLVSVAPQLLASLGGVVLTVLLCFWGGIKPAVVAARESATAALRDVDRLSKKTSRFRMALALVGLLGVVKLLEGGTDADSVESALNEALLLGAMLVITLNLAGPLLYLWLVRFLGRMLYFRKRPEVFFARSLLLAKRELTAAVSGSVFLAVGFTALFSGIMATFADGILQSGAAEGINIIDTVVLLTPPIILGLTGAVGRLIVAWRGLGDEFQRYRLAGAMRKDLGMIAAASAVLIGIVGCGLGVAIGGVMALSTSQSLNEVGFVADPSLSWALLTSLSLGTVFSVGLVLVSGANAGWSLRR